MEDHARDAALRYVAEAGSDRRAVVLAVEVREGQPHDSLKRRLDAKKREEVVTLESHSDGESFGFYLIPNDLWR